MGELVSVNPNRPRLLLPDATTASKMGGGHDARTLLGVFGDVLAEATRRFYGESRKIDSNVVGFNKPFNGQDRGFMTTRICLPFYRPGQHLFLGTWAEFRLRVIGVLDIENEVVVANLVNFKDVNLEELRADPEKWFALKSMFTAHGLGFGAFNSLESWRFEYTRRVLDRFSYDGFPLGVTINFKEKNLTDIGNFAGLSGLDRHGRFDILGDTIFVDGNESSETLRGVALKATNQFPSDGILVPPLGFRHNLARTARRFLHRIGLA